MMMVNIQPRRIGQSVTGKAILIDFCLEQKGEAFLYSTRIVCKLVTCAKTNTNVHSNKNLSIILKKSCSVDP